MKTNKVNTEHSQEELDFWAFTQELANNILNLELPRKGNFARTVANTRKSVAIELHNKGFSHREICGVLGIKSPQSVSKYLENTNSTTPNTGDR